VVKAFDVKTLSVIVCIVYVKTGLPSAGQMETIGHHRTIGLVTFFHRAGELDPILPAAQVTVILAPNV
jgi:hypothetical protein